jgi:hypothetical protein
MLPWAASYFPLSFLWVKATSRSEYFSKVISRCVWDSPPMGTLASGGWDSTVTELEVPCAAIPRASPISWCNKDSSACQAVGTSPPDVARSKLRAVLKSHTAACILARIVCITKLNQRTTPRPNPDSNPTLTCIAALNWGSIHLTFLVAPGGGCQRALLATVTFRPS